MNQDNEKIFSLGKRFEAGEVDFNSLTYIEKFNLNRYFSMKNDYYDDKISQVSNSLSNMDEQLNQMYKEINEL